MRNAECGMNYEYDRKYELNAVAVGTGRDLSEEK